MNRLPLNRGTDETRGAPAPLRYPPRSNHEMPGIGRCASGPDRARCPAIPRQRNGNERRSRAGFSPVRRSVTQEVSVPESRFRAWLSPLVIRSSRKVITINPFRRGASVACILDSGYPRQAWRMRRSCTPPRAIAVPSRRSLAVRRPTLAARSRERRQRA